MEPIADEELSCPRCAAPMTRGFVNAGRGPLRWVLTPKENKTVFGGDHLVKQHWVWGRHVMPAARCERCKLGIFAYG
jgi:hypothetical protein